LVVENLRHQRNARLAHLAYFQGISETPFRADRPYHLERTLDEAYYPGLRSEVLDKRNKGQVITREPLIALASFEDLEEDATIARLVDMYDVPILMVPQLWIWRFDRYIVSAHSSDQLPQSFLSFKPTRNSVIDEDSPKRQIGLMIVQCIEQFGRNSDEFPPALQLFESDVAKILSDVSNYMGPKGASKPDIGTERSFLFRITDVQDELAMIQDILRQQQEVLKDILEDPPKDYVPPKDREAGSDYEPWDSVIGSMKTLDRYERLTQKISADATRIEKKIQDELNIKRTFATMEDARTSISLGIAVIGFTVITIIFAPLAFVTALFALPVDIFEKEKVSISGGSQEEETKVFSSNYLARWFGKS
jgi:Mg2+ and Co2+ transporter CorA